VYKSLRTAFYGVIDIIMSPYVPSYFTPGAPGIPVSFLPLSMDQRKFRVANILGSAVRLVFHDAGEFDWDATDAFGPDGCLSNSDPNSGLKEASTLTMTLIENLYQNYCDKISRADFWVLFGKIALESALPTGRFASYTKYPSSLVSGQNKSPVLNIPFQWGRKDAPGSCDLPAGITRLPGHQPGLSEFTKTFKNQMCMTVRDGGEQL
jgi:hypothetical protein